MEITTLNHSSSDPGYTVITIENDDEDPKNSKEFDVFLNFRGEDTRKNILAHLRALLSEKGINTFVDDDQLKRGQYISPQLVEAIEKSRCSVILISPNYASSSWCLEELVHILDCMRNKGQMVIPVFYHVDPSDVRKVSGSFGEAIAKHEKKFGDDSERVSKWRNALTDVTSLVGLDSKNSRDEAKFIREIVAEVSEKLTSKGSTKAMGNKIYSAWSELRKLKSDLESIEAVLEDAEKKQWTEVSVKLWLKKLKEASLEIENVLDEWDTALLRITIQKEEDADDDHQPKANRICFGIPSPFSSLGENANPLAFYHGIAHKIKDLNQRLAEIASEKDQFKLSTTITEKAVERPITISFIDETEVEGRDEEKEVLVSKLLGENSAQQDKGRFQIIPIVGMGGLGKTTFAQLVFNDDKVIAHFDLRIWVCVSDPFDEIAVAKGIIENVEGSAPNINGLESLMQCIVKCVSQKRFLLVLDDVWTKESEKWDKLKLPLKAGAVGSKIVVTTRKEEVAIMMGATEHMITLKKLSEESCWSIFKRRAFSGRKDDERHQLEEIGRRIANKSKGLPLVAKSLGSLMCFKKTKSHWEDVLNSDLWSLKDVKAIFTPFLVGYHDLPAREKICFSYCSVFLKDQYINRDRLIKMWMSQNYFHDEKDGVQCFENLTMRSFFQDFRRGVDGSIVGCKVHDIVHDFAQFLRETDCITIDAGKLEVPDEKAHHLTLVVGRGARLPSLHYNERNKSSLRTLIVSDTLVDCSLFLQLTCLRFLSLNYCRIKILPTSIGDLKHLRYLDLTSNMLEELPESLCDLCNLQTLDLQHCTSLSRLPKGIGKLINLRHLHLAQCISLEGLPKGIGKLASLRSLDTLFVSEQKEMLFDFGDLKRFPNIQLQRTVDIKECRNLGSKDDGVNQLDLKKISQHCERLNLSFGKWRDGNSFVEDSALLEGLEPHQNLRFLQIELYMGTTVTPRWMVSPINLTAIYLRDCKNCEMLPSLGRLPCLNEIFFYNMESVKMVGLEFLGITESDTIVTLFPKLKHLQFEEMPKWEKWEGIGTANSSSSITIMPCLATLDIWSCPVLGLLPDFLKTTTSLQELNISLSEIVEKWCRERTGNEWDNISHVPNIEVNWKYVQKDGVWIEEL